MSETAGQQESHDKSLANVRHGASSVKTSISSRDDLSALEEQREAEEEDLHVAGPSNSTDLKRTASNVLTKVTSRLTTRSITQPLNLLYCSIFDD